MKYIHITFNYLSFSAALLSILNIFHILFYYCYYYIYLCMFFEIRKEGRKGLSRVPGFLSLSTFFCGYILMPKNPQF